MASGDVMKMRSTAIVGYFFGCSIGIGMCNGTIYDYSGVRGFDCRFVFTARK